MLQDAWEVSFLAWGAPIYNFLNIRLFTAEIFLAIFILLLVIFLVILVLYRKGNQEGEESVPDWRSEALIVGTLIVFSGLMPVTLSNRQANFTDFSRYTLASAPGVALLLVALLYWIMNVQVRKAVVLLLIAIATLTHYLNGIRAARWNEEMQNFWWQASWRIPQLQYGTTLVADYPTIPIQEDYFVWGPASLLYYPFSLSPSYPAPAFAALLTTDNSHLTGMIIGQGREVDNRVGSPGTELEFAL